MVEIHVAVEDSARLGGLLAGLAGFFGESSLAYDEVRNEVCVLAEWESRDIDRVIGAFESWLATDGVGSSAKLSIGDASYSMLGSASAARPSRAAA